MYLYEVYKNLIDHAKGYIILHQFDCTFNFMQTCQITHFNRIEVVEIGNL